MPKPKIRAHAAEKKITPGNSGATSSALPGYDQLPYFAMQRLAKRYSLGETKHGRDNWRKGLTNKGYVLNRLGHVIHHALKAIAILQGFIPDDGDDNAGAIMWSGAFLAEAQEAMRGDVDAATGTADDRILRVDIDAIRKFRKGELECRATSKKKKR